MGFLRKEKLCRSTTLDQNRPDHWSGIAGGLRGLNVQSVIRSEIVGLFVQLTRQNDRRPRLWHQFDVADGHFIQVTRQAVQTLAHQPTWH
jgi:hypothetical protein